MNTQELSEKQAQAQDYLYMGQNLLGNNNYSEAVAMLDKSLEYDQMNKDTYIAKGIALASEEKYDDAKRSFQNALKIDKNFADAYFQLGNVEFLQRNYEEGVKNYNYAIFYGYTNSELYFNLGLVYEEQEEFDEAIRNYSKAIAMDDMNANYMVRKSALQILLGKYEEALQTLERLRMNCPDAFEGYHLTAAVYTMMQKYEEADKVLNYALDLYPADKDLLLDRMRVLVGAGKDDEALELLSQAKEMECTPDEKKEILLNEGKIHATRGNMIKAVEIFEASLAIEGEFDVDAETRFMLINAYLSQEDYKNMLRVSRMVDRQAHENAYNLSAVYFECMALKAMQDEGYQKAYEDAVRYYRNISLNDPSRVDAYLFRAMCYKDLKKYDKAMESIDYVLLLQPENGQLHQIRASVLVEKGKEDEAQRELTEAKRLGAESPILGGELLG